MKRIREQPQYISEGLPGAGPERDAIEYTCLSFRSWGTLWIFVSREGVCGVSFGDTVLRELPEKILRRLGPAPQQADRRLTKVAGHFERYLAGHVREIGLKEDLRGLTVFQRRVLQVVSRIPYGETRSYQWVAWQLGQPAASRAVGAACGANPVPLLIPCHRVIAKDGTLGGFSAGLPHKQKLLELERGRSVAVPEPTGVHET